MHSTSFVTLKMLTLYALWIAETMSLVQICLAEISRTGNSVSQRARVVATFINSKQHAFTSFHCRAAAPRHINVTMVLVPLALYAFSFSSSSTHLTCFFWTCRVQPTAMCCLAGRKMLSPSLLTLQTRAAAPSPSCCSSGSHSFRWPFCCFLHLMLALYCIKESLPCC